MKKFVLLAAVMVMSSSLVMAQHEEDARYGNTPEERTENVKKLNYLKFEMESKEYERAAEYLKELMNSAPAASSNIYIWGATIYKNKAARAKSIDEKNAYVDSVMLIYDRRAEYFGADPRRGVPYILGLKARDYVTLNPMDREGVRRFYREALESGTGGDNAQTVLEYFQQLVEDFKGVQIEPEMLLSEYERLNLMLAEATEDQKDTFNTLFASSGAANCDLLEELFAPQIAENPGDLDLITKIYGLMSMVNCSSDFYMGVAEKYYALAPSSSTAIRLASLFESKMEFAKALKYLNEMLLTETDPAAKANLYVRIAASELGSKHSAAAAQAAREAIELNSDNGFAHMFLAEAYVAGSTACSGFQQRTVYWLAYDQFARARSVFEAQGQTNEVEAVSARMASCRANFPTLEDGFMYVQDYQDGNSYHVSCGWISGNTIIRSR